MPEITLSSGESSGSSSGSSTPDLMELLDQAEEAMERIQKNPQLAKMFGVDLSGLGESDGESSQENNQDGEVNADFLGDVCDGLVSAGYGDTSISELADFIDNNPEKVNRLIDQQR